MADDKRDAEQLSDVKASFAWGQLFAGSLIGGLAVWKLLHKVTNTEPSEWFRGLAAAYEEWRDWAMTPFEWLHIDFNADEKNFFVIAALLIAGFVRSLGQLRRMRTTMSLFFIVFFAVSVGSFTVMFSGTSEMNPSRIFILSVGYSVIVLAGAIVFIGFGSVVFDRVLRHLLQPLSIRRFPDEQSSAMIDDEQRFYLLTLLNVIVAALNGVVLLLLNWATS